MKHLYCYTSLVLICFLYSCSKEKLTTAVKFTTVTSFKSFQVQPNYSYIDLIKNPRQPGQNYDTYHAKINDVAVTVSYPYWDSATYPNTINGVPVYGLVTVDQNTTVPAFITPADGMGTAGMQFVLILQTLCGLPSAKLTSDIRAYEAKLSTDNVKKNGLPILDDYVKGDYGPANCQQVMYNYKLIRCTTGSTFAIATSNYPYAARASNSLGNPTAIVLVTDPWNSNRYELYGTNGVVTGYANASNGLTDLGSTVSGTYIAIPNNSTNFHCIGKILRKDGSIFDYDVTQDIY